MTGLRWTHKTTRKIARELGAQGFAISHTTVARLLRAADYALRTNRKRLARTHEPERDAQFQLMERQRRRFRRRGWPVLSVDTKKKELVGNFKNPRACWRKEARAVLDHDFASAASGAAFRLGGTMQGATAASCWSAPPMRPRSLRWPRCAPGGWKRAAGVIPEQRAGCWRPIAAVPTATARGAGRWACNGWPTSLGERSPGRTCRRGPRSGTGLSIACST